MNYLNRFRETPAVMDIPNVQHLPGPTGESNTLHMRARKGVFCAGPSDQDKEHQLNAAHRFGCGVVTSIDEAEAVIFWGDPVAGRTLRQSLAARDGQIIPLIQDRDLAAWWFEEYHTCIDTTAAGGNAQLLGE